MQALATILYIALTIYWWIVLAAVIFSWLYAFNVVNARNQFVSTIGGFLYQITEPALRPIRRFMPAFSGIDISPIVLFLVITFIRILLYPYTDPTWT